MSGPEVLPEGSISQIFVLGLSLDFMSKNGNFLSFFSTINFYIIYN